jgi:hypothetical protein
LLFCNRPAAASEARLLQLLKLLATLIALVQLHSGGEAAECRKHGLADAVSNLGVLLLL